MAKLENRNEDLRRVYTEDNHEREDGHCEFPLENSHEPPVRAQRSNSGRESRYKVKF